MINLLVLIYFSRFACWNVLVNSRARNVTDQLVSEAFLSLSSKHRSQLIKLSALIFEAVPVDFLEVV